MSIIKKVDGKEQELANKSVIDHSQLSNREAYGAHPISAIRKLPEKLTKLQSNIDKEIGDRKLAIEELDEKLEAEAKTRLEKDDEIETKARQINLVQEDTTIPNGKLVFTDYEGNQTTLRTGYLPDDDTLSLETDSDGKETLGIKKVYIDEDTLSGLGSDSSNEISVKAIKDEDGIITPKNIRDKHSEIDTAISNINKLDDVQEDRLYHLETVTQGMGGYLAAYDFETATPTLDDLNAYALSQITTITDPIDIYNGTKVVNLYDKHLWVLTNDGGEFEWTDQGQVGIVSDANNDGLHGLITGSDEYLEGSIQHNGTIIINGLDEELEGLKQADLSLDKKIEAETTRATKAEQTLQGNIDSLKEYSDTTFETKEEASTSHNDLLDKLLEAREIAIKYLGEYVEGTTYKKHDMVLFGEYYFISLIDDNKTSPELGEPLEQWVCVSIHSQTTKKVEITPTTDRVYFIGDVSKEPKSYRTAYRPNYDVYVDTGVIYDTRGKLASDIELEELYNRVVDEAVKADDETIVRNEDKTITAIGLHDAVNGLTKSAESIIKATTIVVLGEGE